MKRLVCCMGIATWMGAQQAPLIIRLEQLQVVQGMWKRGPLVKPARCDANGNLYFRAYQRDRTLLLFGIRADGGEHYRFELPRLDDRNSIEPSGIRDFAVSGGEVYVLAQGNDQKQRVLRYRANGEYRGLVKLEENTFTPTNIGVLPASGFLLFGFDNKGESTPARTGVRERLALYDLSGARIKNIEIENRSTAAPQQISLAGLSLLETGIDGVYLLTRAGKSTSVSVLSAAGEVTRHFTLEDPGPDFAPTSLRPGGTQFLVEYAWSAEKGFATFRYLVYDSLSGERISDYESGDDVGGVLGCYDWRGRFTFVASRDDQRAIVHAVVR